MSTGTPESLRSGLITGALSLIVGTIGYLGLSSYLDKQPEFADAGFWPRLYYTIQLFVLDSTPLSGPPYGVLLTIAMFVAPLVTVLAVLQAVSAAFRAWWAAWLLTRAHGHSVVVGSGLAAFVLAQRLAAAEKEKVVLVGSGIDAEVAQRHGITVVDGAPSDEKTLRAAGVPGAARVFALDEEGAANAGVALLVRSLRQREVAVYARVVNAELVAAMRARRLGAESDRGFRLDFFSLETTAAIALLDDHDDHRPAAVVGTDSFADAVVRELKRRRRRAGVPAEVSIVACDGAKTLSAPAGCTFVCSANPDEVLRVGLQLLLAGHGHVVLCLGRRSLLAGALEERLFDRVGGQLTVFGILDAACDPARLERSALVEQLARALHAKYLREYGMARTQPSHEPWETLSEHYKTDNREHAEHIGSKLADISAVIVPSTPGLPEFSLDNADIEQLARMEHERWMAGKQRAGVGYGEQLTPATHPDMRGWDDGLTPEAKEKDRMFIRNLPALLADEDLAIVRLTSDSSATRI